MAKIHGMYIKQTTTQLYNTLENYMTEVFKCVRHSHSVETMFVELWSTYIIPTLLFIQKSHQIV